MAVHLSIGRIGFVPLAVPLAGLVGLAVVAGAVYLPTRPGPEVAPGLQVETAPGPGPGPASVAPEPSAVASQPLAVAPQPLGARRHAAEAGHHAEVAGLAEPRAQPLGEPLPEPPAEPLAEPLKVAAPASAVAESGSGTGKAPATGETETARVATAGPVDAGPVDAGPVDAGPVAGAGEPRAGFTGPQAAASQPLDRIGIDKVEQSHAADGVADGDSKQPRSALAPREQVAVARRAVEPRDLVAPRNLAEPRNLTEPGLRPGNMARPENMAPIPVRAPRRADAGTTARSARARFERGAKIKLVRDANVTITARNIPENDRLLEAYSADQAAGGSAAPGLLGIATQAYRTQASAGTENKAYSLADAMRDAVWRKKTAAKLKTLLTARNTCLEAEEDSGTSKPSIGLGTSC